jgi:outer membrane protein OmpA-like peptidoglycan-associated protein
MKHIHRSALFLCLCLLCPSSTHAQRGAPTPEIPLIPGLTFVLAVHNSNPAPSGSGIAVGDYEMVVGVESVTSEHVVLKTKIDAEDESQRQLQLDIERRVPLTDLEAARLQILGFHTQDPVTLSGTTALGPSLAVLRDLRTTGQSAYSVKNFNHLSTSSGTLERAGQASVPFKVLINGQRTELPAMRVTGRLTYNGNTRPWEFYLLDHPKFPLTLRFSVGGVGKGFPFDPEVTREIVRIDFPVPQQHAVEEALSKECRVEVPGLYFDFNRATINPKSKAALDSIADLLGRHPWSVTIEGHTDNVGSDTYNDDLSARRAEAVKTALVRDYSIASTRLSSAGFGEKRPRESNDTIAGRARNRRVELVRDCSKVS